MTTADPSLLLETATRASDAPVAPGAVSGDDLARAGALALGSRLAGRILVAPSDHAPELVEQAIALRMDAEAHTAWLRADLGVLVGALEDAGVRSIVLKGGALVAGWLDRPADRHLDDIDLWVHPDDVAHAESICDDIGWAWSSVAHRLGVDGRPLGEHGRATHHALAPRTSPNGTSLDLHRHLPGRSATAAHDFERWWRRAGRADVDGVAVPVPHADDLLWHLCDHVIRHHLAQPRFVLRHLADLTDLGAGDERRADMDRCAATPTGRTVIGASLALWDAAQGRGGVPRWITDLLLAPDPQVEQAIDVALFAGRMVGRVAWDAVARPGMLARKIVPTDAWMRQEYGVTGGRVALWRARVRRLALAPIEPFIGDGGDS